MFSFSMDKRSMSSSPLVNSIVKNRLFKTTPYIDEPPFQFINIMDLFVVDAMLYDSPNLVIHRIEIWAVWRSQVGRNKSLAFLDAAVKLLHVRGALCRTAGALSFIHSFINLKQEQIYISYMCWNKVVTGHSPYRWQQYDVIMTL